MLRIGLGPKLQRVSYKVNAAMVELCFLPRKLSAKAGPALAGINFLPHKWIEISDKQGNAHRDPGDYYLYSYRLMAYLAAGVSTLAMAFSAKREGIDQKNSVAAYALGLLGGALGAFGLYHLETLGVEKQSLIEALQGVGGKEELFGFSWFGGVAGGLSTMLFYAKIKKIPLRKFLDALIIPGLLFHAMARVGCLIGGDTCYGKVTELAWGVDLHSNGMLHHPTPAYHTISDLIVAGLIYKLAKHKEYDGQPFLIGLSLHALSRFIIEFWRTHPYVGDTKLTAYQITSLVIFGGSALLSSHLSQRAQRGSKNA